MGNELTSYRDAISDAGLYRPRSVPARAGVGRKERSRRTIDTAPADYRQSIRSESREQAFSELVQRSSFHEAILRAMNFTLASAALLILSPLILVIAVAIKLDSPGPVFYSQIRVGLDRRSDPSNPAVDSGGRRTADLGGKPFLIHKFRTLHTEAENGSGPTWGSRNDERCTRVGRFLRPHRLDELPQLWNVVKGDMAIVGPRPERPGFVNYLRDKIDQYPRRQRVRPGITGWAQINQDCDQTVDDVRRKIEYDLEYLQRRSLWFDLWIMLRTPRVMLAAEEEISSQEEENGTHPAGQERRGHGSGALSSDLEAVEEPDTRAAVGSSEGDDGTSLLIASNRRWFTSALGSVLEPAGFRLIKTSRGDQVVQYVEAEEPDLVLLDEELSRVKIPELCRSLVEGPLPSHVPLVLYTPGLLNATLATQAVDAGAWTVLHEPIRATFLVAILRRLLSIGRLVEASEEQTVVDSETGLLTIAGLIRALPPLGALAVREETRISCAVVGPTRVEEGSAFRRQRRITAELCSLNIRGADVCGWLNQKDLAIVAYDTPAEGATRLVDRLNELARESDEAAEEGVPELSAGIVELDPPRDLDGGGVHVTRRRGGTAGLTRQELVDLYSLATAESALQSARETGGGIRVAEGRA